MGAEEYIALLSLARVRFGGLTPDRWSVEKARLEGEIEHLKTRDGVSVELMRLELDLYLLGLVSTGERGEVGVIGRMH